MRERRTPKEALVECLERLRMRGFEPPDRMAWLSLTSKNERPLCDAVAWELHGVVDPGIGVAREWGPRTRRFDIAVLEDGAPVALVEAKAAYAAEMVDAKRPNTYLLGQVRDDIRKLHDEATGAGCAGFVLVFLTHNDRRRRRAGELRSEAAASGGGWRAHLALGGSRVRGALRRSRDP